MRHLDVLGLLVVTVFAAVASLHLGVRLYAPDQVWQALTNPVGLPEDLIITSLRVPRTIVALIVGAALATSGLLMQAVFRNPLAEPSLLGVNAGASFAVVAGFSLFGISSFLALSVLALIGSIASMIAIFSLVAAVRGTLTPVSLVLAGVTLAAFLSALTQVLVIIDEGTMEALLFWLAGGFADRDSPLLWILSPAIIMLMIFAVLSASALDALSTGDSTAFALGVDVFRLRLLALGAASALAAFAVVIAGPVGFLGLVAPHLARQLTGINHAKMFPRTALIGSCLAVVADIAARLVVAPQEVPITAMLAVVGAPVLVLLIRRRKLRSE